MRIAMVAPVWERVPPKKYGGIELVVYLLTEELVKNNYEVTLFATGDSITSAKLESVYPSPPSRKILGNPVPDLLHVDTAYKKAKALDFDIIHNHGGYTGVALADFVEKPVLTTLHGVFTEINLPFFRAFKNSCYYNSISDAQRELCPELNYIGTVYNAIDISTYEYNPHKRDYFVYISRICEAKGSNVVIDVAKEAGVKLVMAGKIDPGEDQQFFEQKVEPKIDGKQIIYEGEVSEEEKRLLLRDAKAFIFPLQWREPFGLIMIEAMACGTPVISFPYGSVPEVVVDKKTGFLVKTKEEMVEAVGRINGIDPAVCREHTEKRFSVSRMTEGYLALYSKILKKAQEKKGMQGIYSGGPEPKVRSPK